MTKNDKITVHKVNLGYDIEEEIETTLKEEISEEILKDAEEILVAISERPGNKKAIEKIELEKKLEECCSIIESEGKITKDQLLEITGLTIYAITNTMRAFAIKYNNKSFIRLSKKSDDYGFEN